MPPATKRVWNEPRVNPDPEPPQPTDAALLARARGGDDAAFHALVDRHAPGLYVAAVSLVGRAADAEDLLQETFTGAFRGLARFEGRSSVKTWLTAILVRRAAMHRRRARRKDARLVHLSAAADTAAGRPPVTGTVDARLDVMDAIRSLRPEHREAIVLRELQGLAYDEMAEALGVPRGTVESRLFRARQALRERLGDYLD
ncbi:MAG: sigma-70 family RNA polymerase sigma factor [Phycisphaerae bacterium]